MDAHDLALTIAGAVGSVAALIHALLLQRNIVGPLVIASDRGTIGARRLAAGLLQYTTFSWLAGGIALVAAAASLDRDAKLMVAVLVGSSYLFGAACNLWATRGRHPGWIVFGGAGLLALWGAIGT